MTRRTRTTILVPTTGYNEKNTDALRAQVEADLLATFGAFTQEPTVYGVWREDSTGWVWRDQLVPYWVDHEGREEDHEYLRTVAEMVRKRARQIAVYMYHEVVHVELVKAPAA